MQNVLWNSNTVWVGVRYLQSDIIFLSWLCVGGHDTQHSVIQHNDTQHNDFQHNDFQHNDFQHNNR
jgi:hypothetical protein